MLGTKRSIQHIAPPSDGRGINACMIASDRDDLCCLMMTMWQICQKALGEENDVVPGIILLRSRAALEGG